jgi:hypothetical protein
MVAASPAACSRELKREDVSGWLTIRHTRQVNARLSQQT